MQISSTTSNRFPRSAKYPLRWVQENEMGPNPLWFSEFLTEKMNLRPGMRILDLGCGKACSSIFLAKEFNIEVWSTDLWISATEMYANIRQMNASSKVFPIHSDARQLPYAEDFFDAIVCIDAYAYFGTDDYYFPYLLNFLKKGGEIGIVTVGTKVDSISEMLTHFGELWNPEMICFHTASWWKNHWDKTGLADITTCDSFPNAWQIWHEWESCVEANGLINPNKGSDTPFIERDAGKYVDFFRIVARKR